VFVNQYLLKVTLVFFNQNVCKLDGFHNHFTDKFNMPNRSACDIEVPDVPLAQFDDLEILDDSNLERCILPKSTLGNR